ncbi:MAG: DUF86 domain-containing protein [Spirochaetales bacterium]|nr:DUF86 domain-containing protein [Spirochaetales bacterium]
MPITLDDVCLNKAAIMERCLNRVFEEYQSDPMLLNWTHVDALVLNLERACQSAIDLAMHLVSREHLGLPQNSFQAFELLLRARLIKSETAASLASMVGFRNIAIHEYRSLDLNIVKSIVKNDWKTFVTFAQELGLRLEVRSVE